MILFPFAFPWEIKCDSFALQSNLFHTSNETAIIFHMSRAAIPETNNATDGGDKCDACTSKPQI